MKRASYSLWPEARLHAQGRSPGKLIAFSFLGGVACATLAPLALSYYGGLVEVSDGTPAVGTTRAEKAAIAEIPRAEIPRAEILGSPATMPQPRVDAAGAIAARTPDQQMGADIPLPIPRPPNIAETSKAVTAFTEAAEPTANSGSSSSGTTSSNSGTTASSSVGKQGSAAKSVSDPSATKQTRATESTVAKPANELETARQSTEPAPAKSVNERTAAKPPIDPTATSDASLAKTAIDESAKPRQADVKPHRTTPRYAARPSRRDDVTIVHTSDGRRLRIYGLNGDELDDSNF